MNPLKSRGRKQRGSFLTPTNSPITNFSRRFKLYQQTPANDCTIVYFVIPDNDFKFLQTISLKACFSTA